ncbi:MAG TPA: RNA polymerase sigma factor [bacterium]|nr:RNA polymerase sigma factor [bacterium]
MDPKDKNGIDEKGMVERARGGDIVAFESLIRAHETKLHAFALNLSGGRRDLAQDLLQEALLQAYRGIASFRGESSFSSWLWRILRNTLLRYRERKGMAIETSWEKSSAVGDTRTPSAEESLILDDRLRHLRTLISLLSLDDQEVLTLIDLQELPFEEAARLIGIPVDRLKPRIFRARQRLAELVMKHKDLFL